MTLGIVLFISAIVVGTLLSAYVVGIKRNWGNWKNIAIINVVAVLVAYLLCVFAYVMGTH